MRFKEHRQAENRRIWVDEQPLSLPVTGATIEEFENYEQADIAVFTDGGENE